MSTDWRSMDRAARSAAYDNSAAVADSGTYLPRWQALSATLRGSCPGRRDIAYGPRPRNRIDLYACGRQSAPLLVFIHGGYWQRNSKEDFACMAIGPLARGFDVALLGYTLAPDASLTTIVGEIEAALAVVARLATGPLILSGWSAGGHLAALGLGHPHVHAVLAISGIYDLSPLRGTAIDDAVHITEAEAADLSPSRRSAQGRTIVAYGGAELPEMCRQSRDYDALRRSQGHESRLLASPGADHFSVLDGLVEPSGDLTKAVVELAGD